MLTVTPGAHAHDVELDDTFDFLNTYELQDGVPVDHLPDLSIALDWFVDRGVIHMEGADRIRAIYEARPAIVERDLSKIRSVRRSLRELADAIVEERTPDSGALATVNRALHARQVIELVAAPNGCSVDHRHVGDPIDDALARIADPMVRELADGHPDRIRVVRQRPLPVGLLRQLAVRSPALVRHDDVRQPGQGGTPSREGQVRRTRADIAVTGRRRRRSLGQSRGLSRGDHSAAGTCARTDWIAWTAPISAADSAGMTIFVFGLSANLLSVSSCRIATSVGSGWAALIAP